jgi:Fe-S oxidoreductase
MQRLADVAKKTNAWACYDCGKCTATCPISRAGANYSPRRHVLATNLGDEVEISQNGNLGTCLTCGLCDRRCPAEVAYTPLILKLREFSFQDGALPECTHGGALQSMMRMMAQGAMKQDRMGWLTDDLKTKAKKGDIVFWTGCTMYYDAFFTELGVTTLEGTKAAIRLMNKLGDVPVVSPDEKCCGHDLLWNGDRENFEKLAKQNAKMLEATGAETVVVGCAECLRTLKEDYEPFFEKLEPTFVHLTEYLADKMNGTPLKHEHFKSVTFQDPCRLGRHLGIYDPPRELLEKLPGAEVREMRRTKEAALCCAGGTWSQCDKYAKKIQVERLKEAKATGAEVLATACPKCQVHFRCTMQDPQQRDEIEIEMRDIAELVSDALFKDSKED